MYADERVAAPPRRTAVAATGDTPTRPLRGAIDRAGSAGGPFQTCPRRATSLAILGQLSPILLPARPSAEAQPAGASELDHRQGRGLHSSTILLNLSRFCH